MDLFNPTYSKTTRREKETETETDRPRGSELHIAFTLKYKLHGMLEYSSDRRQNYHITGQIDTVFSITPTHSVNARMFNVL